MMYSCGHWTASDVAPHHLLRHPGAPMGARSAVAPIEPEPATMIPRMRACAVNCRSPASRRPDCIAGVNTAMRQPVPDRGT